MKKESFITSGPVLVDIPTDDIQSQFQELHKNYPNLMQNLKRMGEYNSFMERVKQFKDPTRSGKHD